MRMGALPARQGGRGGAPGLMLGHTWSTGSAPAGGFKMGRTFSNGSNGGAAMGRTRSSIASTGRAPVAAGDGESGSAGSPKALKIASILLDA